MSMYLLSNTPYLDKFNKCYKNIIIINKFPNGPLSKYTRRINLPLLSDFQKYNSCCELNTCGYALISLCNCSSLMSIDELPDLITFLISNNYEIDYKTTKLLERKLPVRNNNSTPILFTKFLL